MRESTIAATLGALWFGWLVSWLLVSAWSARTIKRAPFLLQLPYRVITLAGGVLLFARWGDAAGEPRLWAVAASGAWIAIALVACGFAFAWWARLHLGRLWSGTVTQKEGHRIVEKGPYAIVRHPIYTGLLLSALATAALVGTARALVGVALMTVGFWLKARLEERFLRADLGAAYDDYRRRVPMLVPLVRI
jgi:protein-S-isoprenylcysteine O-methyltransferase Ste14